MTMSRTSKPLLEPEVSVEGTGIDRLYKRYGVREVSFTNKYPDGRTETLAHAPRGDLSAIAVAEKTAKRKALDIQAGQVLANSVAELIDRFKTEVDQVHYRDQSKEGKDIRDGTYGCLMRFFERTRPGALEPKHCYQYLDTRARCGAPIFANEEMALMQTVCHYAVRWGLISRNPFVGLMQNKSDRDERAIERDQVVRFYWWALRQNQAYRTMGLAAMFCYLTGFRAAEIRPYHRSGLTVEGVRVTSAKRKKGEAKTVKLHHWSRRLWAVVERAKRDCKVESVFLFPNRRGRPYSKSDGDRCGRTPCTPTSARSITISRASSKPKKMHEAAQWIANRVNSPIRGAMELQLTKHPEYFALSDVRPAAITTKLDQRNEDAYDFAAHADPATTNRHYDRRKVRRAAATE